MRQLGHHEPACEATPLAWALVGSHRRDVGPLSGLGLEPVLRRAWGLIFVHCFGETPAFFRARLEHFPNAFVGFTGCAFFDRAFNTYVLANMEVEEYKMAERVGWASSKQEMCMRFRRYLDSDAVI